MLFAQPICICAVSLSLYRVHAFSLSKYRKRQSSSMLLSLKGTIRFDGYSKHNESANNIIMQNSGDSRCMFTNANTE